MNLTSDKATHQSYNISWLVSLSNFNGKERIMRVASITTLHATTGVNHTTHSRYRWYTQTLYASALITINKGGYTKHYFEGMNRICSKIGGGFYAVDTAGIVQRVPEIVDYDKHQSMQQRGINTTFSTCIEGGAELSNQHDLYEVIMHEAGRDEHEPVFYYHSDHLGSAAYLTDDAGQVTQMLNYLPYGEDWVDIQNNLDPRLVQYTFNGKEKDYESGFHYYGARYYWSELLAGWLSVDPMMDKYPSISPYAYCAWNPIRLIDPDGREVDESGFFDKNGNVKWLMMRFASLRKLRLGIEPLPYLRKGGRQ